MAGAWREQGGELAGEGLGHLGTSEVGEVLERLWSGAWRGTFAGAACSGIDEDEAEPGGEGDPKASLPLRRFRARRRRPGLNG
jgi:hypothetical protein